MKIFDKSLCGQRRIPGKSGEIPENPGQYGLCRQEPGACQTSKNRQPIAGGGITMHYTIFELDQYRNHVMSWFRRIFCRLHLQHCHRCRERLTSLRLDVSRRVN